MLEEKNEIRSSRRRRLAVVTDLATSTMVGALALSTSIASLLNFDAWINSTVGKVVIASLAAVAASLMGLRLLYYRAKGEKGND